MAGLDAEHVCVPHPGPRGQGKTRSASQRGSAWPMPALTSLLLRRVSEPARAQPGTSPRSILLQETPHDGTE